MSLVTATFEYSDVMVCEKCGTNDGIHYNLVVHHGSTDAHLGFEGDVWCVNCMEEANMIDPECYEGGES